MPKQRGVKQIVSNRKAFHDYSILEKFEAGIELSGTEVKSVRNGGVNLKDSFCAVKDGELFARGIHISPYEHGNIFNRDPRRPKRLLMHRREINRLYARVKQDGLTLIPLSLYFKDSLVKVEIALARGKKLYDKRAAEAERGERRRMDRNLKEVNQ
jgi:SsrA-binding protein